MAQWNLTPFTSRPYYFNAQPYFPALTNPISNAVIVVGSQFCSSSPKDLIIKRISFGELEVNDVNGSSILKFKTDFSSFQGRKLLNDVSGNAVLSMQRKITSAHGRWQVFKGDSKYPKDLLFSAKQPSLIPIMNELDVYLANNKSENTCDFKIKGSWIGRSCTIFKGESNNIIAQMHMKHSIESLLLGKDTFMVTVYPHIDYAFIATIIMILDAVI